jgi:hypothetical protein
MKEACVMYHTLIWVTWDLAPRRMLADHRLAAALRGAMHIMSYVHTAPTRNTGAHDGWQLLKSAILPRRAMRSLRLLSGGSPLHLVQQLLYLLVQLRHHTLHLLRGQGGCARLPRTSLPTRVRGPARHYEGAHTWRGG